MADKHQKYNNTSPATGRMLRSNDTILNLAQLLERMLTAVQNIDVDIDSVTINTQEVEDALERIRLLTVITNNLIAAGNVDLAALEVLVAAGNALLTTIDADTGGILTAVQLIDNMIGTIGSAHGTGVGVIGMKAEGTVPTEVADGQTVAVWGDRFGRLVQLFTDLATQTAMITDTAPAQMQKSFETGWAALTAPDDESPEKITRDYENITFVDIIDIGGNDSMDVIHWGSLDEGANWFQMGDTEQYTADGVYAVTFTGVAVERVKTEFDAEAGNTDGTLTPQLGLGN